MSEEFIMKLAWLAKNDGGVTAEMQSPRIVENLDEWLFPRWPSLTQVVPEKRLLPALMKFLSEHKNRLDDDVYLGIWRHEGKYYIDLNAHVAEISDARRLAKTYSSQQDRHIISMYNPARDKTEEI